jgi:hypothetical protein
LLLGDERRHNRASPVLLLLLLYTQSRDTRCLFAVESLIQ